MERLENTEIADLYSQIQYFNNRSISKLIDKNLDGTVYELNPRDVSVQYIEGQIYYNKRIRTKTNYFWNPGSWGKGIPNTEDRIEKRYPLSWACIKYAKLFKDQIISIIKRKQKTTETILDIIQILAPAIAQELSGIPVMAIVAAITVMCRRGVMNYIDGSIVEL